MDLLLEYINEAQFSAALIKLKLTNYNKKKYQWTKERLERFSRICAVCGIKSVTPAQVQKYYQMGEIASGRQPEADRQVIASRLQKHRLRVRNNFLVKDLENWMGGPGSEVWQDPTFKGYSDKQIEEIVCRK